MQANRRSGQSTFSGMCPLCKIPLNITDSSSSQHPNNVKVRPKYLGTQADHHQQLDNDITRMPTSPPPSVWQYESPDFEVESSLSTLSLIVDAPTHPQPSFSPKRTDRLPYLDEIDAYHAPQVSGTDIDKLTTNPPKRKSNQVDIDEIDTLPPLPGGGQSMHSLVPANPTPTLALTPVSPAVLSTTIHQGALALTTEITDLWPGTAGNARGS